MAAFSYQHPTFVFDSFLVSDTSNMSSFLQQPTIITTKPCFSPTLPAGANECSQEIPLLAQIYETSTPHKISCGTGKQDTNSSLTAVAMAGGDQSVAQMESTMEKKRKNVDVKVGRERRGKKERENNSGAVGNAEERKRRKPYAKKQKKLAEDTPNDYVLVRARRGQATDSHSLAERVRRAKISVRMKLLQSLVPGCDKITGKAQILDEIIKYVQTLQTQVEFLAAKLASVTSMFNDFEIDFNINPHAQESLDFHQLPTVLEPSSTCDRIQSLDFHQFPEKTPNPNPLLLYQEQRSKCNDNGNLLWDHSPKEELANEYARI